jgi:hypothetical protein
MSRRLAVMKADGRAIIHKRGTGNGLVPHVYAHRDWMGE